MRRQLAHFAPARSRGVVEVFHVSPHISFPRPPRRQSSCHFMGRRPATILPMKITSILIYIIRALLAMRRTYESHELRLESTCPHAHHLAPRACWSKHLIVGVSNARASSLRGAASCHRPCGSVIASHTDCICWVYVPDLPLCGGVRSWQPAPASPHHMRILFTTTLPLSSARGLRTTSKY